LSKVGGAPFHTPVFVLTHERRAPWERPGGMRFFFVDDGFESASVTPDLFSDGL
jgi:hypothetical protein